jgi:hypothetical protein
MWPRAKRSSEEARKFSHETQGRHGMSEQSMVDRVWPFVLRRKFDAVRRENYTLRDALREANAELLRHRRLLAGVRAGSIDVVGALDRISRAAALSESEPKGK